MAINTTAGLLDAIVLAVVGREETGTYGYKITQEVRTVLDLSRRKNTQNKTCRNPRCTRCCAACKKTAA